MAVSSQQLQFGTNLNSSGLLNRRCAEPTLCTYSVDQSSRHISNDPNGGLVKAKQSCNNHNICGCLCSANGSLELSQSSNSDVPVLIENHFCLSQTQPNQILSFRAGKSSYSHWSLFFPAKEKYFLAICHERCAIRCIVASEIKIALRPVLIESLLYIVFEDTAIWI